MSRKNPQVNCLSKVKNKSEHTPSVVLCRWQILIAGGISDGLSLLTFCFCGISTIAFIAPELSLSSYYCRYTYTIGGNGAMVRVGKGRYIDIAYTPIIRTPHAYRYYAIMNYQYVFLF